MVQQEREVGHESGGTAARGRTRLRVPTPGNRARLVLASALMLRVLASHGG